MSIAPYGGPGRGIPFFHIHRNGVDQAGIVSGVDTKVQLNSIVVGAGVYGFDSHAFFDRAVNFRFQPTIAGLYFIHYSQRYNYNSVANDRQIPAIFVNGGLVYTGDHTVITGTISTTRVAGLVPMNGSSDYVEFFTRQTSGVNQPLFGATTTTFGEGWWAAPYPL